MTYARYNLGFEPTIEQARKIESVYQITNKTIRECALALAVKQWIIEEAVSYLCNDHKESSSKSTSQNLTLKQELATYGEVRNRGCVLKTDGFTYLMYVSRNVTIQHSLACEYTDNERLEAHWSGFIENQNPQPTTTKEHVNA